jgi:hypothetical protein
MDPEMVDKKKERKVNGGLKPRTRSSSIFWVYFNFIEK